MGKCWQPFEDLFFVIETVQLIFFIRGHIWYPIQSTEKYPVISFFLTVFLASFGSGEEHQDCLKFNQIISLLTSSLPYSV